MLGVVLIAQLAATCTIGDATQMVAIVTNGWNASAGLLFSFERRAPTEQWLPKLDRQPVFVGKKGLGWGRGLALAGLSATRPNGPVKREGDRRSPAGIFRLGAAFGSELTRIATKLPVESVEGRICVDDASSTHYTERLSTTTTTRDWRSFEDLASYQRAIVVEHNIDRQKAAGSCIFIHDGVAPTPGCSASDSWTIDQLLTWLDPKACPILVQLPRTEYERAQRALRLPSLRHDAKLGCCSN